MDTLGVWEYSLKDFLYRTDKGQFFIGRTDRVVQGNIGVMRPVAKKYISLCVQKCKILKDKVGLW